MNIPKIPVNEGKIDRSVRIGAGVVFLVLAVFFPPLALVFIIISVVLLASGAIGFCGLYKILGINTCSVKK